jgi:hypothetical protein
VSSAGVAETPPDLTATCGRKLGRRLLLPEFVGVDADLGAASGVLVPGGETIGPWPVTEVIGSMRSARKLAGSLFP